MCIEHSQQTCATSNQKPEKQDLWKSFQHELLHHFPYATLSVSLALMLLTLITVLFYSGTDATQGAAQEYGLDVLFHSFHFIHILFAVSGTIITFSRYSDRIVYGVVAGMLSAIVFCTFSDVLLPYVAGTLLGVDMELHICFGSELLNILPFLIIGVINGWAMSQVEEFRTSQSSLVLHFIHTFISAMASIFYAVGHGLSDFYAHFGMFFLLMVIAVIVPCTLSDVVAPMVFANFLQNRNDEKNNTKKCH